MKKVKVKKVKVKTKTMKYPKVFDQDCRLVLEAHFEITLKFDDGAPIRFILYL